MDRISLKEARMLWNPPVSTRTVNNYVTVGLCINGKTIYLEGRWNGGRRVTSKAWVEKFQRECDQARAQ